MHQIYIILLLIPISLSAQIPTSYYDNAEGLRAKELKTALYSIIKGHTAFPYTSSSTDTWDILKKSDRDPNNSANVILFYTGWSVNAAQEYNNGAGWNREHVWAKSHGDFGTTAGAGTDAHHLRPSDISVNGARDSRWFDFCDVPYLDGGLETGCFTSNTSYVWQPRPEVMGDVARMIFYMATRYEGENGEPDLELIDYLPANDYTSDPVHALLSTLLEWHVMDSIDSFERNRNEVIYSYQNNRNPFIDRPEFVNLIYQDNTGIRRNSDDILFQYCIYPNPAKNVIELKEKYFSNKPYIITNISGYTVRKAKLSQNQTINIESLSPGLYFMNIENSVIKFIKE